MTSSKTVKLQTKKLHQIEAAILIPPSKDALKLNLDIFSTDRSYTQKPSLYFAPTVNLSPPLDSIETSLIKLPDGLYNREA